MTFLYKVLLGSLVLATLSLRLLFAMDICKEKDKDGFKLKLLGTALFKEYLLLIVRDDNHKDYTVYKVPFSNFDNSYGQMLLDIQGQPIEEYWPMLKTDPKWKELRENVISIWLIDKVKPYLYFIVPAGQRGSELDVEAGKWVEGLQWNITTNSPSQWISSADTSHTYTNKINDYGLHNIYLMYVWDIILTETGEYIHGHYHEASHLYYAENKRTNKVENITFMYNFDRGGDFVSPDDDPYLNMPGYENYHLVNLTDWNLGPDFVPPGFVFKGQIHMFSLEKVFIFADRLTYEDPRLQKGQIWYSTPVKAVLHKDYFKCQKLKLENLTYPPVAEPITPGSKGGSLTWLWILLAILLLLLLILLLVCMCRSRKKAKGHHNSSSHKKHSSQSHKSGRSRGASKNSSMKRASSRKRASSLKRNSSAKRHSISKLSHNNGTRRSSLKAK